MNFRSVIIACALTTLLASCTLPVSLDSYENVDIAENISYVKDKRTGLCFATIASTSMGFFSIISITEVPCDKVEALLPK